MGKPSKKSSALREEPPGPQVLPPIGPRSAPMLPPTLAVATTSDDPVDLANEPAPTPADSSGSTGTRGVSGGPTPTGRGGGDGGPGSSPGSGFDLKRLRLGQNFAETAATVDVPVSILVRKPKKHEFVRVRAGDEWRFPAAMLELDGEMGARTS